MYKAITNFADLQDNNYRYHAGDIFPRDGFVVSPERLEELATDKNRRHKPVIAEVDEPKAIKTEEKPVVKEDKPVEKPKKGGKKKTDVK